MKQFLTKIAALCIAALMPLQSLFAQQEQENKWDISAFGGLQFGAASPIPVPKEVTKIYTWYPKLNPELGVSVVRWMNLPDKNTWGLYSGVSCEFSGMEATTQVKELNVVMGEGEQVMKGHFTGDNLTEVRNGYLTIPLGVAYRNPSRTFSVRGGFYGSLLLQGMFKVVIDGHLKTPELSEPLLIDLAEFDFSDKIRSFDFGLHTVFTYHFNERVGVRAGVKIGFNSIARRDFEALPFSLHNTFASVGISYRLSDL